MIKELCKTTRLRGSLKLTLLIGKVSYRRQMTAALLRDYHVMSFDRIASNIESTPGDKNSLSASCHAIKGLITYQIVRELCSKLRGM